MKKKNILLAGLLLMIASLSFVGCKVNDPMDNLSSTVAHRGANVYWELPTTLVKAGDSVEFSAQYWSLKNEIHYIGVWYDINSVYKYSATNITFGYTLTIDTTNQAREFQEIKNLTHRHTPSLWNDSLRAYQLKAFFPASYTLASTLLEQPINREDALKAFAYFPTTFEQLFKKNLLPKLFVPADSAKVLRMFTQDYMRTDTTTIRSFYKIVFDPNSGGNICIITEDGKTRLTTFLHSVPIDSLTYNFTKQQFEVLYNKSYTLGAKLGIKNEEGIINYSYPVKTINVQ